MPSKKEFSLMTKALGLEGVVVTSFGFIGDRGLNLTVQTAQMESES